MITWVLLHLSSLPLYGRFLKPIHNIFTLGGRRSLYLCGHNCQPRMFCCHGQITAIPKVWGMLFSARGARLGTKHLTTDVLRCIFGTHTNCWPENILTSYVLQSHFGPGTQNCRILDVLVTLFGPWSQNWIPWQLWQHFSAGAFLTSISNRLNWWTVFFFFFLDKYEWLNKPTFI